MLSPEPSRTQDSEARPSPRHDDRLLSPQDLADYLEVPVKTIYRWRHHNKGPRGFRAGKHLRFRWADVQSWITDRMAEER